MLEPRKLLNAISEAGFDPRSYSGRNMHGKHCIAVIADSVFGTLADIVGEAGSPEEAAELVRTVKTDSMGRDSVIYWPRMIWDSEWDTSEGK